MEEPVEKPKEFVIRDRRSRPGPPENRQPPPDSAAAPGPANASAAPPALDFSSFVLSLAASRLASLNDSAPTAAAADLTGAQQIIEILALLQSKTQGNLTPAENQLIGDLLYQLRIRFVEAARRAPG